MINQYCALIDERLVEDTLFLRRRLGMPRLLSQEPVIDPGEAFGPVIRDKDGRWTMWYLAYITRNPETDVVGCETPMLMAYSNDGVHWEKPNLGIAGDPAYAPNTFMHAKMIDRNGRYLSGWSGWCGLSIIDSEVTPHPHARARFTGMTLNYPMDSIGGISLAYSDDGIHWTMYAESPVIIGSQDTLNTFLYDAKIGKYVCYQRPDMHCGVAAHANRKMARSESEDLIHWSPSRIILDADERDVDAFDFFDEPGMRGPRGRSMQFQGMSPFILNGCYLAFTWFYDCRKGTFVNELIHSEDGIHWQREALREPFVADGRPAGLVAPIIVPAADAPVLQGDEYYFYANVMPYNHHALALAEFDLDYPDRTKVLESTSIYGFAIKRDRWVGYEARDIEGEILSTPIDWEGGSPLYLNTEIKDGGYIRLEVEDQWGRPVKDAHLDEIHTIEGPLDELDHIVGFGPGKTIMRFPPVGPIRLRMFLKHATVYGWSYVRN